MPTQVFDIQPDGTTAPMVYNPNEGTVSEPPAEDDESRAAREERRIKKEQRAEAGEMETVQKMVTSIVFPSVAPGAEQQHVQVTVKDMRVPPQLELEGDYERPKAKGDLEPPRKELRELPTTQYKEYEPVDHTFSMGTTHIHVMLPVGALVKVRYAQTKTVQPADNTEKPEEVMLKEAYAEFTVPNSPQMLTSITIEYLGTTVMESPIPEIEPVPESESEMEITPQEEEEAPKKSYTGPITANLSGSENDH